TLNVKPGMPTIFEWDWNPPLSAAQHSCLLVICDSPTDPIPAANKVFQISTLVVSERHVGLKNLHVVDPPPADAADSLVIQYQMRALGSQDIVRLDATGLRDWKLGIVVPSKIAKSVKTTVKPVKVPSPLLKQILAKGGKDTEALKDSRLLQFET